MSQDSSKPPAMSVRPDPAPEDQATVAQPQPEPVVVIIHLLKLPPEEDQTTCTCECCHTEFSPTSRETAWTTSRKDHASKVFRGGLLPCWVKSPPKP